MHARRGGLRRLAILFAIATVGVLAVGAQGASANVIEICKSSANGMSGRSFQYSISGGPAVSVNGGRCSGPIQVTGATATITEAVSNPATDVASTTVRPSLRKLSENLQGRSVTVTTGASTASETLVTFTNQPAGGNYGTLKVCKLTQTPAYLGRLFSFSANGGPIVSTEANDAFSDSSTWSCRILGTFQVGSNVTVQEQIPAGTEVQFVDADPAGALADFNTATGTGVYTIGAGVTIALFDDEPTPPSGTGWLEICKDRAWLDQWHQDWDVQGVFHFSVTDANGTTYTRDVLAGQCSEPFQVAAGISEVTEGPSPGFDLVDVFTAPEDRLLTTNLINRTADVEVPASGSQNDETQVHFVNKTQRGQLKVCKALGPGSADLIGQKFYFEVSGDNMQALGVWITAQAQTQCVIVGNFPIGSTIDVEETCGVLTAGLQPIDGGDCNQYIDVSGEGEITLAPGINTKTITNTAKGLLEICKAKVRGINVQPTFQFRIDSGGIINVRAGTCTLPQRVSVGNHTVSELAAQYYELDPYAPGNGITVLPADREVSRNLASRQITVSVPYGPNGETLVTFYNRIKTARVKVCKTITPGSVDALSGKTFTFTVYFNNVVSGRVGPLYPGECAFAVDEGGRTIDFPVLDPNGVVSTTEVLENGATDAVPGPGTFYVTGISVTGNNPNFSVVTNCQTAAYSPTGKHCKTFIYDGPVIHVVWTLGAGVNVATFTNTAGDP